MTRIGPRVFREIAILTILLIGAQCLCQQASHAQGSDGGASQPASPVEALAGASVLREAPGDNHPAPAPEAEAAPQEDEAAQGAEKPAPGPAADEGASDQPAPAAPSTPVPDESPDSSPVPENQPAATDTGHPALAASLTTSIDVTSAREGQVLSALKELRESKAGRRGSPNQDEDLRQRVALWRTEVEDVASSATRRLSDLKSAQRTLRADLRVLPWKARRRDISIAEARRRRDEAASLRAAYDDLFVKLRSAADEVSANLPAYREAASSAAEAGLSAETTRDLKSIVTETEQAVSRLREAKRIAAENANLAAQLTRALDPAIDAAEAASLLRRSPVRVSPSTPVTAYADIIALAGWVARYASGRTSASEYSVWLDSASPLGLAGSLLGIIIASVALVLLGRRLRQAITVEAERRLSDMPEEEATLALWRLHRWLNVARAGLILVLLHVALRMLPLEPRLLRSLLTAANLWCGYFAALAGLRLLVAPSHPRFRLLTCPDAAARHVYSVTIIGLLISAALIPLINALGLFDYPHADVRIALRLCYGAALVALFIWLINGKENSAFLCACVGEGIATDLQTWAMVARPVMSFAAVGLLVVAVAGYVNLADYAARGIVLTSVMGAIAFPLQRRLAQELEARFPTARDAQDSSGQPVEPKVWAAALKYSERVLAALVVLWLLAKFWGAKGYHAAWMLSLASRPLLDVKGTKVSVLGIVEGLAIVFLSHWVARYLQRKIGSSAWLSSRWDEGAKYAIASTAYYLVFIGGVMVAILVAGMQLTILAAFAGMVGIAVGFGSQDIAKNIICGLIIMLDRSINVGDYVDVAGQSGTITDVGIRSTTIRTQDNRLVVVPNATFYTQNVTVSSQRERRVRVMVELAVGGDADFAEVSDLLTRTAQTSEGILSDPPPDVSLTKLAPTLNIQLSAWTDQIERVPRVQAKLVGAIWTALKEHSVPIA